MTKFILNTRAALKCLTCAAFVLSMTCNMWAQVVHELPSPAATGSGQSNLMTDARGRVYLSWIERLSKGRAALRFAVREGKAWSMARTIAEGEDWFVNWADFPSIMALPDGSLAAHWLVKSGPATYAYDVRIARSFDGGKSWSAPITPHRDRTKTEHGFVSMFPAAGGGLGTVWLDGRETKADGHGGDHDSGGHGQMTLRYATIRGNSKTFKIENETLVDARVCECCQTSAALTSEGPVVVYRDRTNEEIRDISIVRLRKGRWTQPQTIHADNWRIDGCPVNGPSVAASARRVAVAWFTMGDKNSPRVRLVFSEDAGATFSTPIEIDDGDPVGRVAVMMLEDGSALVSWIERTKAGAEVRARRVRADGTRADSITVAPSGAARSSGFPRMARVRDKIIFSWTGTDRVHTAEMALR